MLALLTLIGGLRGVLTGMAGAGAMFGLLTAYHATFVHPGLVRAATVEGARVERVQWEEAQRRIRIEAERKAAIARSEITRIELDVIAAQIRADDAEQALEEIIHELETADPAPGVVLRKRMSEHLNKIGR